MDARRTEEAGSGPRRLSPTLRERELSASQVALAKRCREVLGQYQTGQIGIDAFIRTCLELGVQAHPHAACVDALRVNEMKYRELKEKGSDPDLLQRSQYLIGVWHDRIIGNQYWERVLHAYGYAPS